jgi:pimeloyl-ACP methyl ester carboxylesterase
MRSETMKLPDGRTLSWAELGSESATSVLVHQHGTGSSRLELTSHDEDFAAIGVRVIAPERPGYGQSTAQGDGRSVIDWAIDVAALVDGLGVETFAVSGFSGGGPYALGLAASPALGPRVSRVLLRAALAPAQGPRTAHDIEIRERAGRVSWRDYEDWYESRVDDELRLAPADEQAFADSSFAEAAMATLAEGSRQGPFGDAADQWAFATPWRFDLASIGQPVEIWHGDADTVVPVSHAHVLFAALPNARLRVCPNDGHFSIALRVMEQAELVSS